ncbi:ABC transporter permease subunit [Halosimplex amylolyticum]|uniref:ABC transporter permease subunit n=1 Tax=Halosimplex amylolyticum TaxID=3396616 RepID=UPI003F565F00
MVNKHHVYRVGQAVLTVFAVITLSFGLIRLMPGGPMDFLRARLRRNMVQSGGEVDEERLHAQVEAYTNVQPDRPILEQYVNYMTSILTGDFGQSLWYREPVAGILVDALPWTFLLMSTAILSMFVIGIVAGGLMAWYEGSGFDLSLTGVIMFLTSVPYYVFAVLALLVFAYQWGWFPISGRVDPATTVGFNVPYLTSVLYHAFLPYLSLVVTGFGGFALGMRGNSISILGEDYIRVAQLRGLSNNRIAIRYVARNAILPMYTGLVISVGTMFGGAVILERLFNYQGLGYFLVQALEARDYPLMMGGFILITTAVVIALLFADLTYAYIDPRIGSGQSRESYGGDVSLRSVLDGLSRLPTAVNRTLSGEVETDHAELRAKGVTLPSDLEDDSDADSIFRSTTDTKLTRTEQLYRFFDTWIATPFRILWNDWRGRVGMILLGIFVVMGVFGPIFIEQPGSGEYERLLLPFEKLTVPFGTDYTGRSLFAKVVHATPAMLKMILAGSVFATGVAVVVGLTSGYIGGTIDRVTMTFSDIMMTIPGLPLIIVVAAIVEPKSPYVVGILLSINAWAGLARSLRSEVLSVREQANVEASRLNGLSTPTIIGQDILPTVMPFVMVSFMNSARGIIFSSVGLYFLGLLPSSAPNWGVMLNSAWSRGTIWRLNSVHEFIVPMVVIILFSFSLILLAQASDHLFNPQLLAKHGKTKSGETLEGAQPSDD